MVWESRCTKMVECFVVSFSDKFLRLRISNLELYKRLNEGFATLYENYLASLVYPEDRLMDTFVIDTVQTVLDTDANPSIRPMTYYVESPERITGLFDRVAYDKCKFS